MSTENRSSNTEQMVSVPLVELQRLQENMDPHRGAVAWGIVCNLLERPTQHQGEPLIHIHADVLKELTGERKPMPGGITYSGSKPLGGWTIPLYTHAATGEDESAPECFCVEHGLHIDTLRARLAERDTLLRDIYAQNELSIRDNERIEAALSASAEPAPTAHGFSAGDMADQGAKAFRDGQRSITELTDDLREILGRPNFACHHIAQALRQMGHTIAKKSEDEQASVIHWMLGHYLKYGPDWRPHASDELKAASQAVQ